MTSPPARDAGPPLLVALLTYSTRPRGGVVHTLALAEALAAQGHEVTVWTLARHGDTDFFRQVAPAVQVRAVPLPDVADEGVGERILRSIAVLGAALEASTDAVDVVHAQDCISANAAGDRARATLPGYLRTVHHIDHFTTPELVACHERAIREPHAHICVSAAVAAELADGWGIDATVIPNGVDAARFAAAAGAGPSPATERVQWRDRLGRYVLAVGGIEPRKGTADLVEAMALVQAVDPALALVIAGGETLFDYRDYRVAVLARADELGVRLQVLGPVDDEALPSCVAAAEAFAFPSLQEGFGLAAMEALAAGVPLVVRDLPVLREVFAGAARFAPDVASLASLLLDAAGPRDEAAREAGHVLAASHSWADSATAHVRLYRRLLAAAGRL